METASWISAQAHVLRNVLATAAGGPIVKRMDSDWRDTYVSEEGRELIHKGFYKSKWLVIFSDNQSHFWGTRLKNEKRTILGSLCPSFFSD